MANDQSASGTERVELDLIDKNGTVAERIVLEEGDEFAAELLTDEWTIKCRSLHTETDRGAGQ